MMRPFDVVVVPFPYTDRLTEKRRPALVVSMAEMPDLVGRVWLAMITTAPVSQIGDVALSDIGAAGLPVPSTLRGSKIATLDAALILRRIGRLSDTDEKAAREALRLCAAF